MSVAHITSQKDLKSYGQHKNITKLAIKVKDDKHKHTQDRCQQCRTRDECTNGQKPDYEVPVLHPHSPYRKRIRMHQCCSVIKCIP